MSDIRIITTFTSNAFSIAFKYSRRLSTQNFIEQSQYLSKYFITEVPRSTGNTFPVCDIWIIYSVMQSDGISFCGDVVSDSFNKTSRDEDKILYQIYKSKYVYIIIMMILIFHNIRRTCKLKLQEH